ncbi:MAG: acyl-CoA dehydrogenase family protein [Syntrophomonadaceae bacterium]|jgi:alkylation response protein AidB-like acyl-CoA dehydrogenase|nr:acyl-CoA dehydrogenase family protein [Syntrophomonadaceae bacterium]
MNFRLTEEQEMIRQMTADFTANEVVPYAGEWDKNGTVPFETIAKMQDLGLMTIGIPAEYGGDGLDWLSKYIVCDELAQGDAGLTTTMLASTLLASDPIWVAANDEQKKWWYGRMLEGAICAFCLTEPEAGSDALGLSCKCVKDGNDYILNGTKQFITNGEFAKNLAVIATLDKKLGNKGICAFMVDRDTPGITVGPKEDKLGIRSTSTNQIIFEDVRVPGWMMLGGEGEGTPILMETLDLSRTAIAAMATGIATAALNASITYANERHQFGKPITAFQAISFMLADMATAVETSRLLYQKAAWLQDNGQPFKMLSNMAKMYAADSAMKVSTDAVQIHGGYGYVREYPVEKYMRDAKIMQIFEGTVQVQRMVIGKYLSKNGYQAYL